MNIVKVGQYVAGNGNPLMLLAGPCVLEGMDNKGYYPAFRYTLCIQGFIR